MELRTAGSQRAIPSRSWPGPRLHSTSRWRKPIRRPASSCAPNRPCGRPLTASSAALRPPPSLDLSVGEHAVASEAEAGSARQVVTIEPGATASLVVQLTAPPPSVSLPGWISVSAPADVEVYENNRLLGSSKTDQLMVTAGRHDLEITAAAFGFRTTRTVQVVPGKVSSVKIEFPKGTLALNAIPWADVWVDGENVGQTPIGGNGDCDRISRRGLPPSGTGRAACRRRRRTRGPPPG